jgi:hypothetical protein
MTLDALLIGTESLRGTQISRSFLLRPSRLECTATSSFQLMIPPIQRTSFRHLQNMEALDTAEFCSRGLSSSRLCQASVCNAVHDSGIKRQNRITCCMDMNPTVLSNNLSLEFYRGVDGLEAF